MVSSKGVTRLLKTCKVIRKQVKSFLQQHRESSYDAVNLAPDAIAFLNRDPLAPIIATICDERISAKVAWELPLFLCEWLKQQRLDFKPSTICSLEKERLKNWFASHMQDKWPKRMSEEDREDWLEKISDSLIKTCERIWKEYNDDPDSIFIVNNGKLTVPLVYLILRQFPGIGAKKASMIARDFGRNCDWFESVKARLQKRGINLTITQVHFSEIPIDVHVRRVFRRLGFSGYFRGIGSQDFQNLARIIHPKNPGLVDDFIWDLGREICKSPPKCEECPLSSVCEYRGEGGEPGDALHRVLQIETRKGSNISIQQKGES